MANRKTNDFRNLFPTCGKLIFAINYDDEPLKFAHRHECRNIRYSSDLDPARARYVNERWNNSIPDWQDHALVENLKTEIFSEIRN